jgi:hypothetical protein
MPVQGTLVFDMADNFYPSSRHLLVIDPFNGAQIE